jgi:tetratricopeptide (TPR) repeat protein
LKAGSCFTKAGKHTGKQMKTQRIMPLLIVAAGLLVYHNIYRNPFLFDDHWSILDNLRIRHLWPTGEILTHSSRPVVELSLALNYAIGGLKPAGYHLLNVLIHIAAGLTLYGVVRRTVAPGPAGAVALIWVVHPLQTESVSYTIQRAESLMSLFYLLTLYCVIRGAGSRWWHLGAVASCAAGMATKEVMVTAPVVVLLYDRVFLARSWREVVRQRWGLYAGLAATWLLLPVLMTRVPADVPGWQPTAGFAYKGTAPREYALTQPGVVGHYLRLAVWPHPLILDYGWGFGWPVARTLGEALPGLVVLLALLALTGWALWKRPKLGFVCASFFLILSPTSTFVPIADLVVEHRMYLPLAAVITIAVMACERFLKWWMAGIVICVFGAMTIARNADYSSELRMWGDTVQKCLANPRAHHNFGVALESVGRIEEARGHYDQAVRIKPDYFEARNNLGKLLLQPATLPEAINQLEQALRIKPDFVEAHCNLGNALLQVGKVPEAISHLEQAVRLKPGLPVAQYNLGNAFLQAGRFNDAIRCYEQALRLQPNYVEAHCNLGNALIQAGRAQEAVGHYERAIRLRPELAEAHYNLGFALAQIGRTGEAVRPLEQAMRIRPNYAEPTIYLAWLLASQTPATATDATRAVTLAERACDLTGRRVPAYLDILGVAYAAAGRFDDAIATTQKAIELARLAGQSATQFEARLELYRARQPDRQPSAK